jgi:hypothetical protein
LADEREHAAIRDALLESRYETIVVYLVEEFLQVNVHDPLVTCLHMLFCLFDGRVTASARPKAVAPIVEGLFVMRTEHLVHSLLHDSIDHVWYA